jgi:hypothetical protein
MRARGPRVRSFRARERAELARGGRRSQSRPRRARLPRRRTPTRGGSARGARRDVAPTRARLPNLTSRARVDRRVRRGGRALRPAPGTGRARPPRNARTSPSSAGAREPWTDDRANARGGSGAANGSVNDVSQRGFQSANLVLSMHRTTEGPRRRSPQNHDRRSPTWTQFVARLIDDELPNRRLRDHRAGMASPRFLRAPCVRAPRAARRRGRLRRVRGRVRVQPRAHRAAGCAAEARGGRRGCGCRLGGPRDRPGARAVPHAVRGLRLVGARAEAGGRPAPPGGGWRGGRRRGHRLRRLGEGVLRQDQLPDRQAATRTRRVPRTPRCSSRPGSGARGGRSGGWRAKPLS